MSAQHFFDTQAMEWTPHPRFPTILTKALQSRAENEVASVTLVRVDIGGVIDLLMLRSGRGFRELDSHQLLERSLQSGKIHLGLELIVVGGLSDTQ